MKSLSVRFLKFLAVLLLTALTQVGGIVFIISLWLKPKIKYYFKGFGLTMFILLYSCTTFLVVPLLAPLFGREKIEHTDHIKPTNYMTVLLNRNYVAPAMNKVLEHSEKVLSQSNTEIHYLDACFPFIDQFPLLPHLSHNDGNKLDLSFVYLDEEGKAANKEKSVTGYGVFVEPKANELNQIDVCEKQGHWQYDITKYVSFGRINSEIEFSERLTKQLVLSIVEQSVVKKVFIEPHLKTRLQLFHPKVRYHGCHAVRHDDHIHIELK